MYSTINNHFIYEFSWQYLYVPRDEFWLERWNQIEKQMISTAIKKGTPRNWQVYKSWIETESVSMLAKWYLAEFTILHQNLMKNHNLNLK